MFLTSSRRHIMGAALVVLAIAAPAHAQNLVGTWRLDPVRTNLRTPDGALIAADDGLTILVRGTYLDIAFPENSLSGTSLPVPAPCCHTRLRRMGARDLHAQPIRQIVFSYDFSLQHEVRVIRTGPRSGVGKFRLTASADLSGLDVVETGPWASEAHFRTSPDGETLTIDTTQGAAHMVRVFTRQR